MANRVLLTADGLAGMTGQVGFERVEIADEHYADIVCYRRGVVTRTEYEFAKNWSADATVMWCERNEVEYIDEREYAAMIPDEWDNIAWLEDDERA